MPGKGHAPWNIGSLSRLKPAVCVRPNHTSGQVRRCRPRLPTVRFTSIAGTLPRCRELAVWANSGLGIVLPYRCNMAGDYCALCTVFPKVISGLRKPIAIQAAISFNINLPE